MSMKDFDVSHLSANNTLKVIQDIKIKTIITGIFHECIQKCEVCLLFSFNRVFNFSIPAEHFELFEIIPIEIPVCVYVCNEGVYF